MKKIKHRRVKMKKIKHRRKKRRRNVILGVILALLLFGSSVALFQPWRSGGEGPQTSILTRVEAKYVCMGMATDRLFQKEQIPVEVDGRTYYG
ncbi:MAG: hypothetical protein ACE5NJ_02530 [Thermodesulfobacteriota bacterium]